MEEEVASQLSALCSYNNKLNKIVDKSKSDKIVMDMVIHDLRNPINSI